MKQLPDNFARMMIATLGDAEYQRLAEAIDTDAPTSIRLNRAKVECGELADMLREAEQVAWCDTGFYLAERPQFTFDPLLHAGCYYVQEASSMYVGDIIRRFVENTCPQREGKGLVALDACAAPGGKSTLALDCLPYGSLLVANEYVRQRAHVLVENLTKWGNPNIIATNSDTRDFARLEGMFDIIICDAPCSGEGMFRKDPKAIEEWSMDNVCNCQLRQREIVRNLWPSLKPGGLFIYSTCTFNRMEDEENVEWMRSEFDATLMESRHFYPHLAKGEGFFVASFTKHDSDEAVSLPRKKKKGIKPQKGQVKTPAEVKTWLNDAEQFSIAPSADGSLRAFPSIYNNVLESVANAAHVIHYGIQLAETKGKQTQPCHGLAMSPHRSGSAFHTAEIEYATAIAYLRGEAITLPADTPRGYVVVAYHGHPLGFAKNVGNRANNMYPTEWRIKSTHVPTSVNAHP